MSAPGLGLSPGDGSSCRSAISRVLVVQLISMILGHTPNAFLLIIREGGREDQVNVPPGEVIHLSNTEGLFPEFIGICWEGPHLFFNAFQIIN